jgi:hypothetical protein
MVYLQMPLLVAGPVALAGVTLTELLRRRFDRVRRQRLRPFPAPGHRRVVGAGGRKQLRWVDLLTASLARRS